MKTLEKKEIDEIKREFPQDKALQEIHFAKRLIEQELKYLSPKQIVKYFNQNKKPSLMQGTDTAS